ncbi:beta-propeller fold lactonase family protein [Streptomyces sp. NPDC051985]|uniref:lactonase family protein n=1 Tax=Streptomyces sp. NPDC051985 TaxID=3155807 RepID=UPI0034282ED7
MAPPAGRPGHRTDRHPGPDRSRQTGPHLHHIPCAPDRHHVLAPGKDTDRIHRLTCDAVPGRLTQADPEAVTVRSGAGPRHIVYHWHLPLAYVADELNSRVTTYTHNRTTGGLAPRSRLPTLPSDFTDDSTAADIQLTPEACLLFVSHRGHDSVVTYAVQDTGTLHSPRWTSSGGRQPRFFPPDPADTTLYAANQPSDMTVVFHVAVQFRVCRRSRTGAVPPPPYEVDPRDHAYESYGTEPAYEEDLLYEPAEPYRPRRRSAPWPVRLCRPRPCRATRPAAHLATALRKAWCAVSGSPSPLRPRTARPQGRGLRGAGSQPRSRNPATKRSSGVLT